MALGSFSLGKVYLKRQVSVGTPITSWSAGDALECEIMTSERKRDAIAPKVYQGDFTQPNTQPGTKAGGDVTLRIPLAGLLSTAPGANPTPHHLAYAIADCYGALSTDGYQTDLTAGSTTTAITVTSGVEAHAGHGVGIPIAGATASYGIAWIKEHTLNVYTLVNALLGTPPSTGTILGGCTAYYTPDDAGYRWTLAHVKGVVGGTTYFDGTIMDVEIQGINTQQPMAIVQIKFPDWQPYTAGAITPYPYSWPRLPVITGVNGGRLTLPNGMAARSITAKVTCTLDEKPDWSRSSGVAEYTVTGREASWVLEAPLEDEADLYEVGDDLDPMQADFCTISGRGFGLFMGAPRVVENAPIIALGQLIGQRVKVAPARYTGDTETTAPAGSPLRAVFF